MATNYIKVTNHEKGDNQVYMEHNHICAVGGSESKMKFSSQLVESPPPKPPRRRYSDQLSPPYLGNHPPKKYYEGIQKGDSKSKKSIGKPAYQSLPASLSTSISNEYDDPFNIQPHASGLSDHNKTSKEKEFYMKYFLESLKFSGSFKKKAFHCNRFHNREKLQSVSQDINSDKFLKNQCDSFVPFVVDKLYRYSCNDELLMPDTVINHCQKSVHKNCHRRHSDPVIYNHAHCSDSSLFCSNFLKDSELKHDWEHCCDMSHSAKKSNKFQDCIGNCSCCKKNYFIMQEVKNLKEINEKLWQHLCSLQICLENRKKKNEECADVSVSDLLSSIYYAQKAKDSAMEERLRIVLDERDAALLEIDDLIHVFARGCDYSDSEKEFDEDKKDLLGEVGSTRNLPRLLKCQRLLLSRFRNSKCFKKDSLSHQLRQVTIERNSALEKIRQLEEDVKNMKIGFDLWHSDNKHWEITLFDVLNQIIHQRDSVLSKIDNGLDISNVKYRLDPFQQITSPFEPRSRPAESLKAHHSLNVSDFKQQHSFKTSDEVRKLKEEIFLMNKALDSERKRREQSEKKCLRLERLVHILRKKINGQDIGVHV